MPALIKDMTRDIDLKIVDADLAVSNKGDKNLELKVKIQGMEGER